jgi:hypothetical protein
MRVIPQASTLAIAGAVAVTVAIGSARAANPYDGSWQVTITTTRGACDSGSGFGLQVRNGVVYGYGSFAVSGHVSPNGATSVSVSAGDQRASGSGRLRGNSGGGSWHGSGSRGVCSGSWYATRTG